MADQDDFEDWIKKNGADEALIGILKENGFCSKLSLENLDLDSAESSHLLSLLNYGQTCLLRGLVRNLQVDSPYATAASKVATVVNKSNVAVSLKEKIGKLFHQQGPSGSGTGSQLSQAASAESFDPHTPLRGKKRKSNSGKAPMKKKVKQTKIKIVALSQFSKHTPTGSNRDKLTYDLWINNNASQLDVKQQIIREVGWESVDNVFYLYAQGRNLRPAHLDDVENATSWDLESLKALMGSGALYVCYRDDNSTVDNMNDDLTFEGSEQNVDTLLSDDNIFIGEMFKDVSPSRINILLKEHGYHGAIDVLISEESATVAIPNNTSLTSDSSDVVATSSSSAGFSEYKFTSLEDLLSYHSSKVIEYWSEYQLSIDRSTLDIFWNAVVSFYKGAISKPQKLHSSFSVTFTNPGEVGSDAGALRKEFFEDAIMEVISRLFEGEETRKIPKKDISLEMLFEVAGMLVGHSVLNSGPGLPCLSPVIFDYLCYRNPKQCFPTKEDIPLNIATCELITFIDELDKATTEEDIDNLLDIPSNMAILNNSRWSILGEINKSNKGALLQQLILEEVITRREENLKAFHRGLKVLGFADLIRNWPELTRPLLVNDTERKITAEVFKKLIKAQPKDQRESEAYEIFLKFIAFIDGKHDLGDCVSLPALLKFITGMSSLPPIGDTVTIEVDYTSNTLPKSSACFNKVYLPLCYESNEKEFFAAFKIALEFGSGFGKA